MWCVQNVYHSVKKMESEYLPTEQWREKREGTGAEMSDVFIEME
jgi:hypothetical protein